MHPPKGEDIYQYTLDQAYDHVQFFLGTSFDAAIQTDVIEIDWNSLAAPCYQMTIERIEAETETETADRNRDRDGNGNRDTDRDRNTDRN